jgi:large subunit ribosomal protein L10
MPLNRAQKDQQISTVRERFAKATAAVFLDFRGVDVETITDLRARFRAAGVDYAVVKNNLVKKALADTKLADNAALAPHLKGPTGIAFSYEDPSLAAKLIKAFRKEGEDKEKLTIKCGVLDTEVFDGARVESELATLPGKDELRSMLLATLLAPMQNLVAQLAAPGQNLAFALDARRRQQEGG